MSLAILAQDMLALVAMMGLVVGSFLNVVIARLPEGRSLWAPRSACPRCGVTIAWYDNLPVLSFLMLRARCRHCRQPIAWRYPIVECSTALLFSLAWVRFGASGEFILGALLVAALVPITAIDLDRQIIPDAITLPGVCVGLLGNLAVQHVAWVESLLGLSVGAGIFFVIIVISGGGMGGGDMKLGAMLGAFLGWKAVLVALFVSVTLGGTFATLLLATGLRGRRDPIPFGPFLAAGGVVGLLWGQGLVAWYARGFVG